MEGNENLIRFQPIDKNKKQKKIHFFLNNFFQFIANYSCNFTALENQNDKTS